MTRSRWQTTLLEIKRIEIIWCVPYLHSERKCSLDKGRPHPVLGITREQLPLTLAFVMTAHAAQGQTVGRGAIADFILGGSASAMSSCVALTRVQQRHDLFMLRPCPSCPFSQGQFPDA